MAGGCVSDRGQDRFVVFPFGLDRSELVSRIGNDGVGVFDGCASPEVCVAELLDIGGELS